MIALEKPSLEEAYLEHFGVKGMHWGQRRASNKTPAEKARTRKKVIAGTAAIAVGTVAIAYMMSRRGKVTVRQAMSPPAGLRSPSFSVRGKAATSDISQAQWRKKVSDLRKDIASAHADQDRWMRRQGLGSAVNRSSQKVGNVDLSDLADVRRAMNDPNHIWEI